MKIPKNEKGMVSYIYDGEKRYRITQNTINGKFTLYKVIGEDDYEKMTTADSPLKLDEVINKDRKGK
jgi:hypothetical protein